MKNLSLTCCLAIAALLVSVGGGFASDLPPCPASGYFHNCFGTESYNDGKYVGEFRDDKRHGQGTVYRDDEVLYTGKWFKDKPVETVKKIKREKERGQVRPNLFSFFALPRRNNSNKKDRFLNRPKKRSRASPTFFVTSSPSSSQIWTLRREAELGRARVSFLLLPDEPDTLRLVPAVLSSITSCVTE